MDRFWQVILWIDDVRPPRPAAEYNLTNPRIIWCHSVNEAINQFNNWAEQENSDVYVIDMDHDAGDYAFDGGDYINFLNYLEWDGFDMTRFAWRIHSMNPVGVRI